MYLRETRWNKDGSVVSYLQLAHNERHPVTGSPVAKVVHNFGRAGQVDRAGLSRLVASISRFLDPAQAVAAAVRSWDVADPAHPRPFGPILTGGGAVASVAFNPDGHTLASGSLDGTIRLWNVTEPAYPARSVCPSAAGGP